MVSLDNSSALRNLGFVYELINAFLTKMFPSRQKTETMFHWLGCPRGPIFDKKYQNWTSILYNLLYSQTKGKIRPTKETIENYPAIMRIYIHEQTQVPCTNTLWKQYRFRTKRYKFTSLACSLSASQVVCVNFKESTTDTPQGVLGTLIKFIRVVAIAYY